MFPCPLEPKKKLQINSCDGHPFGAPFGPAVFHPYEFAEARKQNFLSPTRTPYPCKENDLCFPHTLYCQWLGFKSGALLGVGGAVFGWEFAFLCPHFSSSVGTFAHDLIS